MAHVSFVRSRTLRLPGTDGEPREYRVAAVDMQFEKYHPSGRLGSQGMPWNTMISYGFDARLPFTHKYLSCSHKDKYATITDIPRYVRVPDDWHAHAMFIDDEGRVVYYAPENIRIDQDYHVDHV